MLMPKADDNPSLSQASRTLGTLGLPLEHPVVQFRYPARSGVPTPSYQVSLGQFNEFISLYRVPEALGGGLDQSRDLDAG
jgi:hypothetical protein